MRLLSVLFRGLLLGVILGCNGENTPAIYTMNIEITPVVGGSEIPSENMQIVSGEDIRIMALNEVGYTFTGWSGDINSKDNPFELTVNNDLDITAEFTIRNYPLTITKIGSGTVTETLIQAPQKTDYDHGSVVQVQAIPDDSWEFTGWTGDIESTDSVLTLTITSEINLVANFDVDRLDPVDVPKTNDMMVYMHYMPWFTTGDFDGSWSSHWTMANRDPETIVDGKREIASHFYPLIGPYSTNDPDVIEYHLLLMKLIGIDGVLIDWYGTYNLNDYDENLKGSNNVIDLMDEVGLNYGIVYEDRTTQQVVNAGLATSSIESATNDFNYVEANYFNDENYIIIDDTPLALVFTPVHIESGSAWNTIFSGLDPNPLFLSIWGEKNDLGTEGDGEYSWVYNGNNNHAQLVQNFYNNQINSFTVGMGSAYPGFVDFYEEGGYGNIIGWEIQHNGTQTLEQMLEMASTANIDHLQLVTWNDFGEGTMLEPTAEFGFDFLIKIQEFTGVPYDESDLQLVYDLYLKRKAHASDSAIQNKLNLVFNYLITLQMDEAKALLDQID